MKLVLAEKPSVAQSLAKVLGRTNAATDIWKATDMLSVGALAIWWSCLNRKPTMKPTMKPMRYVWLLSEG